MIEIVTNMSAALALLGLVSALACVWRAWAIWNQPHPEQSGRRIAFVCAALLSGGIGWSQAYAWAALETGLWTAPISLPWGAIPYRLLWMSGLVGFGGRALWFKCGHKGWMGMIAVAAAGWMIGWAV